MNSESVLEFLFHVLLTNFFVYWSHDVLAAFQLYLVTVLAGDLALLSENISEVCRKMSCYVPDNPLDVHE